MSRGPRRLLDDPDFQWETGCDLSDEQSVVDGYDLQEMKDAVVSRVAVLAAAGAASAVGDGVPVVKAGFSFPSLKPALFAAAGVATVGTAFWLGVVSGPQLAASLRPPTLQAAPAPPVPVPSPVAVPDPGRDPVPDLLGDWWMRQQQAPSEPSVVGEDTVASVARPRHHATPSEPAEDAEDALVVQEEAVVHEAGGNDLAEDTSSPISEYDGCMDLLDDRRNAAAARCFRDLLHAGGPDNPLRLQVEWSLLRALQASGDAEGTAALAEQLAQRADLADQRGELRLLQAEALVQVGRCDHALVVARDLDSDAAAAVRRACRKKRP